MEPSLRRIFLEQFVLDLIMQKSKALPSDNPIAEKEQIEPLASSPTIAPRIQIPIVHQEMRPVVTEPSPRIHPVYPQPVQPKSPPSTQISLSSNSFEKISKLLQDPRVQGVECTGPNKNVLVNTDGLIKSTSTMLTKEEIDSIMQEISQKTRIPLINGVFKAAFNNYVLTAVVSEFIGTRFVLQKRNPFQPLRVY